MPNGSVYEQWNTVLDEYNDPDWFANQIWDPFSRPSGTMPGFDSWQTAWDFTSPERLQKAYGSYFNRFNTADWDTLDQLHALDIQLLDQEINRMASNRGEQRKLESEMLESKKEGKIEAASLQLDKQLKSINQEKEELRIAAIQSMSELDSVIAKTGLTSGGLDRKKQVELDTVAASINQANFNRVVATQDYANVVKQANLSLDSQLKTSDLKFDAQYGTKLQNIENKKSAAELDLIGNKLDVYTQWKTGVYGDLGRLVQTGVATAGLDAWDVDIIESDKYFALTDSQKEEYELFDAPVGDTLTDTIYVRMGENAKGAYEEYQAWMDGGFEEWKKENADLYESYLEGEYRIGEQRAGYAELDDADRWWTGESGDTIEGRTSNIIMAGYVGDPEREGAAIGDSPVNYSDTMSQLYADYETAEADYDYYAAEELADYNDPNRAVTVATIDSKMDASLQMQDIEDKIAYMEDSLMNHIFLEQIGTAYQDPRLFGEEGIEDRLGKQYNPDTGDFTGIRTSFNIPIFNRTTGWYFGDNAYSGWHGYRRLPSEFPVPPRSRYSDIRLKENIEFIGVSNSGINMYEYEYKDKSYGKGRYRGVMAHEVPLASFVGEDGYLLVDYNKIDIKHEKVGD